MEKLISHARVPLNVVTIIVFLIITCSCNKNSQINRGKTKATKPNDTLLVDSDGNKYGTKVLMDGNLGMTSNLKLNIPNTNCYENGKENCEQYGRLYNWDLAKQGCTLLGEGWRLPSKEEWGQLTMLYGRITEDSNAFRKEAYKALLSTGSSGFNAVLGGGRDPGGKYARLNAHGFYWTGTEYDDSTAWYYNFAKGSQALFQQDGGEKTRDFSVRCVKHMNDSK